MESSCLLRTRMSIGDCHTWMRFHLFAKCAQIGAIIASLPTCNGSIIIKNLYNLFHFKIISHIVDRTLLLYFAFVAVIYYCWMFHFLVCFLLLWTDAICAIRFLLLSCCYYYLLQWVEIVFSDGKLHAWLWHSISISIHTWCNVCVVFDFDCHKSYAYTFYAHVANRMAWPDVCETRAAAAIPITMAIVHLFEVEWTHFNDY